MTVISTAGGFGREGTPLQINYTPDLPAYAVRSEIASARSPLAEALLAQVGELTMRATENATTIETQAGVIAELTVRLSAMQISAELNGSKPMEADAFVEIEAPEPVASTAIEHTVIVTMGEDYKEDRKPVQIPLGGSTSEGEIYQKPSGAEIAKAARVRRQLVLTTILSKIPEASDRIEGANVSGDIRRDAGLSHSQWGNIRTKLQELGYISIEKPHPTSKRISALIVHPEEIKTAVNNGQLDILGEAIARKLDVISQPTIADPGERVVSHETIESNGSQPSPVTIANGYQHKISPRVRATMAREDIKPRTTAPKKDDLEGVLPTFLGHSPKMKGSGRKRLRQT